jgi:hypothetical protein
MTHCFQNFTIRSGCIANYSFRIRTGLLECDTELCRVQPCQGSYLLELLEYHVKVLTSLSNSLINFTTPSAVTETVWLTTWYLSTTFGLPGTLAFNCPRTVSKIHRKWLKQRKEIKNEFWNSKFLKQIYIYIFVLNEKKITWYSDNSKR